MCHCSQCRKAQGGAFATNTPVSNSNFELKSGAELITEYESSPGKDVSFVVHVVRRFIAAVIRWQM
jgi:hypothetical protein